MEPWEALFNEHGQDRVRVFDGYSGQWIEACTLEYLYQMFKARMIDELKVFSGGVYAGSLEDRS